MKFGDPVPEISATTTLGKPFRLSDRRGKFTVIYFYPKSFTPGCTMETKLFRDNYEEIAALGADVVGISIDEHEVQCDFATKMKIPFPLIGDPTGKLVEAFEVKWPLINMAQRVTVIVDPEGKLAGYFHHELMISKHVSDVVTFLKKLNKSRTGT